MRSNEIIVIIVIAIKAIIERNKRRTIDRNKRISGRGKA